MSAQCTTTQSNFTPMRGHVADGTTVKCDNGDVLTITACMNGWRLTDQDNTLITETNSARIITCAIVGHS